jgi:hypothetical protein
MQAQALMSSNPQMLESPCASQAAFTCSGKVSACALTQAGK